MSSAEADAFEKHPYHQAAVRLRRYDDMGKVENLAMPALEDYRSLLEAFVRRGDEGRP